MGEKIVIGPIDRGQKTDRLAFNIDNDSFPFLLNAYQWRGRIKRKRGTSLLGRLTRAFASSPTTIQLDPGTGIANILTGFGLQANGSIIPGTVDIFDVTNPTHFTDPAKDGNLSPNGTIIYSTGQVTMFAQRGDFISASFSYTPNLPVMGLEDFVSDTTQFAATVAFDTTYSYNINTSAPYTISDVSFYKNPKTDSVLLPGYVAKASLTPLTWNGLDYQQFWTTNYQGAMWATNGVQVPFSTTNVGMQFSGVTNITRLSATTVSITVTGPNLIVGDFVYLNEFDTSIIQGVNNQAGYVTAGSAPGAITVTLPFAVVTGAGALTGLGIVQYLTNTATSTIDPIRWYDGNPAASSGLGWVNFSPPLSNLSFPISDVPSAIYYLVGARAVLQFKDFLLFFGAVVQTSAAGSTPIYLQDTIVYSQNGTPYYTSSFDSKMDTAILKSTTVFHPILTPVNQTATAPAYFEDVTGFGGFVQIGLDQSINSVSNNEDVLILGLTKTQVRMVYSGSNIIPFNFFVINSEFGTSSVFSAITLDKGVVSRGGRGYVVTSQTGCERVDLDNPDLVFEANLANNGTERYCAQRDFINEWIYFTYPSNEQGLYKFPNQTFLWNYRDNSWAVFNEAYTTYGTFRRQSGYTWSNIGETYTSWAIWNVPWNAGASTLFNPQVIAGNQQGFVLFKDEGTGEGNSLYISNISGGTITSPQHTINNGDYISISGALGTIASQVNGLVFSVLVKDADTFTLNPPIGSGTYIGGGLIQRMYVPQIQTKQFPVAWSMARKTRLGTQQYLLSNTDNGQITLLIFLSQNSEFSYNDPPIVPAPNSPNNSLIYSQVLFTSPEIPTTNNTVSLGFFGDNVTLTYNLSFPNNLVAGSLIINIGTNGNVASFTDNGSGGFTVTGTGVSGGSSVNYATGAVTIVFSAASNSVLSSASYSYTTDNVLTPTATDQEQIWHRINTSLLGDTVQLGFTMSDDQMRDPNLVIQFEEIELHSIVIDVQPSQVLA